jgi:hypothetical protein
VDLAHPAFEFPKCRFVSIARLPSTCDRPQNCEDAWRIPRPWYSIRRFAIIGAGAAVTKSVGDYEIWAGVPARKIGMRPE